MNPQAEIDTEAVEMMLANGLETRDIAKYLGISQTTLYNRRASDPALGALWQRGRAAFAGSKGKGVPHLNRLATPDEAAAIRREERERESEARVAADMGRVRLLLADAGEGGLTMPQIQRITGLDYSRIALALERMFAEVAEVERNMKSYYRLKG